MAYEMCARCRRRSALLSVEDECIECWADGPAEAPFVVRLVAFALVLGCAVVVGARILGLWR